MPPSRLLILIAAGATAFTILFPSFQCSIIVKVDSTGAFFSTGTQPSPQRLTTPQEATTCQLFNKIAFIGAWSAVGITFIYAVYLLLLCMVAARRNPLVWRSQINQFDWAITSEPTLPKSPDLIRPEMIQRPGNPHLSKDYNDSMMSLALPPVFIDPFQTRKDSFDSATWQPESMEVIHYPLDRHSVMSQYQPRPIQPNQWQIADNMAQAQHRPSQSQSSALGLEGMEGPPVDHRRSKPTLSIYVPPPPVKAPVAIGAAEEDYDRIGRTMSMAIISPQTYDSHAASEEPGAAIGRRMSMPFASPVSSEESTTFPLELGKGLAAAGYHQNQARTSTAGGPSMVQNVRAKIDYPVVQQSVNRQSTMVREDSLTARRSMRFGPNGPYQASQRSSGGILPLHIQDLPTAAPLLHGPYQHVRVMHNRSYSAAATFQSSRTSRPNPLVSSNTWPAHPSNRPTHPAPVYRSNTAPFPLQFPPPPSQSPASTAPSFSNSYYGNNATHGHSSHSRSSSTPSSYQQAMNHPIPALLDALSPVVRNSGNFQGVMVPSSQRQSWRGRGVTHPFLDDNPFGGRSASRTPEGSSISETDSRDGSREDKSQRRASKLRKPLHRNL